MNELDPDLQFIFEELTKNINFLSINLKIIDYSFTKLFQPRKHEDNDKNVITFTITYNPNH